MRIGFPESMLMVAVCCVVLLFAAVVCFLNVLAFGMEDWECWY